MHNVWDYRLIISNIRNEAREIASGGDEGDVKWNKIRGSTSMSYPAYTTGRLGGRRDEHEAEWQVILDS